jgi:hypothetical protein
MKEARAKHHSRTSIRYTHLHLTKIYDWHHVLETSYLILEHRWKRYALSPYLKLHIRPF